MSINPLTFRDITSLSVPHGVGSLFCTILWDLYWAIIYTEVTSGKLGFNPNKYDAKVGGSNIAFQLVVEGLKIQGCNPTFVISRDAILTASETVYPGK